MKAGKREYTDRGWMETVRTAMDAKAAVQYSPMTCHSNKPALYVAVALLLIGCSAAKGQTPASPDRSDCGDDAFASAEKLRPEASQGAHLKALELYQKALQCNPEPAPSLKAAEILLNIGRVQFVMEKNQEALTSFSTALQTFRQIHSEKVEVQKEEAATAVNLGIILSRLGQIDQAMPIYREQRELFHRLKDKLNEVRTLEELGRASFLMGENQSAFEYFSQATRILASLGANDKDVEQRRIERLRVEISDLTGRVYAAMNEPELAGSYFHNALAMGTRTNNHSFVAYTLNDLGVLLLKQNKIAPAESSHLSALKILKQYEPQDTEGIAETEVYLANCRAASGRYDLAIKNYQYALSLQQESQDMIGQAETQLSLGLAESASHQMERALQSLKTAAELYRGTHERQGESSARFEIARIYAILGDNDSAKREVMAAIKLAEEIRGSIPGPSLRIASFDSLEKMYRFEIDLLLNQASISENQFLAFDVLQRAQSRTLLEALQNVAPADDLLLDGDVRARRTELLLQLKKANQQLAWQLTKKSASDVVDQTFITVRRLETSLDQVDAEVQRRQPRIAIISPTMMSVSAIQQELLDEKTALVQFYVSSPASYAWIITKSGTQLIGLPPKDVLDRQVRRVVKFGEDGLWTNDQERALASFGRIIRPIFAASQSTRWVVVPDGALYSFPFALLSMMGKTEREILKIPSASSVRALRSADSSAHVAHKLAVFADPVFDADDSRVSALSAHTKDLRAGAAALHHHKRRSHNDSYPRLPFTREEAALISAFVPRARVMSFLDFAAGLDALADNRLSDFKIIHFATHSLVDYRHPELSRIVLSLVTKKGTARPGYLLLKDIYAMKLSSDLVVLSSCRGAAGREGAGEGPMSLSRAFLFAGSRSVLSTLWEADDETTAGLMGRFYRHMLNENLSPLDALAKTQFEFRHHRVRRLRNPYYWAGFELYGDWRGLEQ